MSDIAEDAAGDADIGVGRLPADALVIESCHSIWLFDRPGKRFRRILKGLDLGSAMARTAWRPYWELRADPAWESFVVVLNPDGSRLARAWRHREDCPHCGQPTTGLSLDHRGAAVDHNLGGNWYQPGWPG